MTNFPQNHISYMTLKNQMFQFFLTFSITEFKLSQFGAGFLRGYNLDAWWGLASFPNNVKRKWFISLVAEYFPLFLDGKKGDAASGAPALLLSDHSSQVWQIDKLAL